MLKKALSTSAMEALICLRWSGDTTLVVEDRDVVEEVLSDVSATFSKRRCCDSSRERRALRACNACDQPRRPRAASERAHLCQVVHNVERLDGKLVKVDLKEGAEEEEARSEEGDVDGGDGGVLEELDCNVTACHLSADQSGARLFVEKEGVVQAAQCQVCDLPRLRIQLEPR